MSRRALSTICFTDVVGSTALRSRLGEERADELRRIHDRLLTRCVEHHGGQVVKGSGDGILAAFGSAADGLSAAVAMQQEIAAYDARRDAIAQLSIRVGLAVGDVLWEDGDCFGTAVNEAARLEAAAEGGQILCSDLVVALARGRDGHEIVPIGELDLKGLPAPVAASEVRWRAVESATGRPLPPEIRSLLAAAFAGREAERTRLAAMLAAARDVDRAGEYPTVAWILGEPGIGKSHLAARAAADEAANGATVLFGRCDEDLQVTYQPMVEALRSVVRDHGEGGHADADLLSRRLGSSAGELARLLPGLTALVEGLPPPTSGSPELERHELFEAVRLWLAAMASEGPLLLVLDDLHWANALTVAMIGHVLRSPAPAGLSVIVTARTNAPDHNEALGRLVDQLDRLGSSHVVHLGGLSVADVTELVGDERRAVELCSWSAGNPLMVVALRASGGTVGPDLGAVVRRRVDALPVRLRQLLHAAALCQHDFELSVLAAAIGRDELEVLDDLELATAARLVAETGAGTFRFEHALVRAALRDEIGPSRRVRLHARLAGAIERVHALRLDDQVSCLAYHYYEAGAGEASKALDYLRRAAGLAEEALALDEAEQQYERALALLPAEDPERAALLLALGTVRRNAGRNLAAATAFEQAVQHAESIGDGVSALEAAVEYESCTWRSGTFGTPAAQMLARLTTRFRSQMGASTVELRVRVSAAHGRALVFSGRRAEGIMRIERALQGARAEGDARLLAHALAASSVDLRPENVERQLPLMAELADLADHLGDRDLWMQGATYRLYLLKVCGRDEDYDEVLDRFQREAEASRHAFFRFVAQNHVAAHALPTGDLALAEREAERAMELAQHLDEVDQSGIHGLRMFAIRREQDRLWAVGPLLARLLRSRPDAALWRPGLALLHAELDQHDEAADIFEAMAPGSFAAIPRDSLWPASLGFLAEVCAYLGDRCQADALDHELEPFAGLVLLGGAFVLNLGPADRFRGLLAATRGDLHRAADLLGGAMEQSRRAGAALWEAHSAIDRALVAEAMGDAAAAGQARHRAAALAERTALPLVRRRLVALAGGAPPPGAGRWRAGP